MRKEVNLKTTAIWLIVLVAALLPVLFSRRTVPDRMPGTGKIPRPFRWLYRSAAWILVHLPPELFVSGRLAGKGARAAVHLEPGADEKWFMLGLYLKNAAILYGGLLAVCIAGLLFSLTGSRETVENNVLQRDAADGSSRQVILDAQVGETEEELTVTVEPRTYSEEERNALMDKVEARIDQTLPGENKDLNHVSRDLVFISGYENENITIRWVPGDYSMIAGDGSLVEDAGFDVPVKTYVTAEIAYGDFRRTIRRDITITEFPSDQSLKSRLMRAVEAQNTATAGQTEMKLPDEIDGVPIVWNYAGGSQASAVMFLIVFTAAFMIAGGDRKLQREAEKRSRQLVSEYPNFVYRMGLMLGSGMTARRSWTEIVHMYESDERERKYSKYLYKEMRYTLKSIESGVPEPEAYTAFAERTGNPSYQHFCRLLVQMIRKGSPGMKDMMLREAENAERNRRNNARKIGAKAGLRLLLPMILLLVVVMTVVMVPAVLTM